MQDMLCSEGKRGCTAHEYLNKNFELPTRWSGLSSIRAGPQDNIQPPHPHKGELPTEATMTEGSASASQPSGKWLPIPAEHVGTQALPKAPRPRMCPDARSLHWAEGEITPPSIVSLMPRITGEAPGTKRGRGPAGSSGDGDDDQEDGEGNRNPLPTLAGRPARERRPRRLRPHRVTTMRHSIPRCANHCSAAPVRARITGSSEIKLITVEGWSLTGSKGPHPRTYLRNWNPLGAQWNPSQKANTVFPQLHAVFLFPNTDYESQFWLPEGMPSGRFIHRRENTARGHWPKQPINGYYGTEGPRDAPDTDLYHDWKPIVAATNVFMAESSGFRLLSFLQDEWKWTDAELQHIFKCDLHHGQSEWTKHNCSNTDFQREANVFHDFYKSFTHSAGVPVRQETPETAMLLAITLFGIPAPIQQNMKPRRRGDWFRDKRTAQESK